MKLLVLICNGMRKLRLNEPVSGSLFGFLQDRTVAPWVIMNHETLYISTVD
jgi:hypothetical protein